ncbi:MAG: serine hydrolase domain-containing protein [Balneolaceae bacterium]|nr:serine hydrolase domain-containing protein [Balneolaceae bacterium]
MLFILVWCHTTPVSGQFAEGDPGDLGFSHERLQRLDSYIQQHVENGQMAGINTLILKDGKAAYLSSHGMMNIEENIPMRKDAIFRIASMSKAITSVAVMILYEEGHFMLNDPVHEYIPEFNNPVVAIPDSTTERGYRTEPAKRPITVRHLLTHTAGLTYGYGVAEEAYNKAGLTGWYLAGHDETIGSVVKRLARLPLHAHPGKEWQYGYSTDVLGYFVEVVSGMSFDEFVQKRIYEPLGMTDTHFFLPEHKSDRLAPVYGTDGNGNLELTEPTSTTDYIHGPRKCFSGGAGILSTITDYGIFLQMLLNGGEFNGERILSPQSVRLMRVNHVGDMFDSGDAGFGLGFRVIEDLGAFGELASDGAYGWGSAYYPVYRLDPEHNMAYLFLTQLRPAGDLPFRNRFHTLVYQALNE